MLLLSGVAGAQTQPFRDDLLYVNPTLSPSSSRLTALANASVGIAEGAESMAANSAAVVQRRPSLRGGFDASLSFAFLSTPFQNWRDLDNDGSSEGSTIPLEGLVGAYLQIKKFGLGSYVRLQGRDLCIQNDCASKLGTLAAQSAIVIGYAFWDDQILVALALNLNLTDFTVPGHVVRYTGLGLSTGTMWRPIGKAYRVGFQAVTESFGRPDDPMKTQLIGRSLYRGTVTPHRLSIGASWRFGPGMGLYNRPSKQLVAEVRDDARRTEKLPYTDLEGAPPGPVLLSVQLDLNMGVDNATSVRPFLFQEEEPPVTGVAPTLVPRIGVEWEIVDHRFRLRAGAWQEPAMVQGSSFRIHGTFGFELFLFKAGGAWSLSGSLDVAPRYLSFNVGLGFWS